MLYNITVRAAFLPFMNTIYIQIMFPNLLALVTLPVARSNKKEKMNPLSSPAHNIRPVESNANANTRPITLLVPPYNMITTPGNMHRHMQATTNKPRNKE